MKIIMKTLMFAFVSTLMMSCSSDDDQPAIVETQNSLKVGSEEFELKSGIIEDFGATQNLYNFDITIYSVETRVEDNDVVPVGDPETASAIYFELFTDNPDDIALGDYDYASYSNRENFTYTFADSAINLVVDEENQEDKFVEIRNGTLEVLSNGTTYELEFTGKDVQDRSISLYYKGSLGYIDATNE